MEYSHMNVKNSEFEVVAQVGAGLSYMRYLYNDIAIICPQLYSC